MRGCIADMEAVDILVLSCALLFILVSQVNPGSAATISNVTDRSFDFSTTTRNISADFIQCGGSSRLTDGVSKAGAMCLTPPGLQMKSLAGRCFHRDPVQFSNITTASFSTMFSFNTVTYPTFVPGEGFTFFLGPNSESDGGTGGYLGWLKPQSNSDISDGNSAGHDFAVEFDIFQQHLFNDNDSNHVGINVNSVKSLKAVQPNNLELATPDSDRKLYVWIDYDGVKKWIDVWIDEEPNKPCKTTLSSSLDLGKILLPKMYAGFTSSTGSKTTDQVTTGAQTTIFDWSFSTTLGGASNIYGQRENCDVRKALPWLMIMIVVIGTVFAAVVLVMGLFLIREKRRSDDLEADLHLLMDYGPREYTYEELSVATRKFSPKNIIGKGGFGTVYQGLLSSRTEQEDVAVAIKKMNKKGEDGIKEFVAEVKVIGRLRHINMVPLLGWCSQAGQLLLVYEHMPNKDVQKLLFPSPGPEGELAVLSWERRLRILRDVAAALVFLHDDCEQRVVHRDVKSNNVMLDRDMNARLGDFGLARLYDRRDLHHSTVQVAGTLGYMAPETMMTGHATVKSDVYSFGAMVLEVLTGRAPADLKTPGQQGLVLWVWKLQEKGKVLEAVDSLLGDDYDPDVMRKVMKMGLFCCLPDPDSRPTMRQVQTVLESESLNLSSDLPSLNESLHTCLEDMSKSGDLTTSFFDFWSNDFDSKDKLHSDLTSFDNHIVDVK